MLSYSNILNSSKAASSICCIFIRWRKPIYAPIAPSKLFRVVERTKQPTEEYYYLKKQFAIYRSELRSIKSYLSKNLKNSFTDQHKVDDELIEQHYKFINESNAKFNEISAKYRQERESIEQRDMELKIKLELEELEMREKMRRAKAVELVRRAKKDSESFITRENLDAAIEQALNRRSTFRFAIDLQGNMYEEQADGTVKIIERKTGKPIVEGNANDSEKLELDSVLGQNLTDSSSGDDLKSS